MMASYVGTIVLYVLDLFEFDQATLGLFMFVVGFFLAFNQAFLSKRFIRRFGELITLKIGLFICAIGFIAITISKTLWIYVIFLLRAESWHLAEHPDLQRAYCSECGASDLWRGHGDQQLHHLAGKCAASGLSGECLRYWREILSHPRVLTPHWFDVVPLAFGLRAPEPTPQKA